MEEQTEPTNDSCVNTLEKIIPDFTLRFSTATYGVMHAEEMMANPQIDVDMELVASYKLLNSGYRNRISEQDKYNDNSNFIRLKCKQALALFGYSDDDVADMLVRALYFDTQSVCKDLLWDAYGEVILKHIQCNLAGRTDICANCGAHYVRTRMDNTLCEKCAKSARYDQMRYKYVACCDCGIQMKLAANNGRTMRCPTCYREYRKKYWAANKAAHRRLQADVHKSNSVDENA